MDITDINSATVLKKSISANTRKDLVSTYRNTVFARYSENAIVVIGQPQFSSRPSPSINPSANISPITMNTSSSVKYVDSFVSRYIAPKKFKNNSAIIVIVLTIPIFTLPPFNIKKYK